MNSDYERTLRNFAFGDTKHRKGARNFTYESFYEIVERHRSCCQTFAMWLSYGDHFVQHVRNSGFSSKGWTAEEESAYFEDVIFDFDGESIEEAFADARKFVDVELLARGIGESHFVIYLSGSKGFHVHVSAACFGGSPMVDAARRFKGLAKELKKQYTTLDDSIYGATSLIRLPGTRHKKTSLFKAEIPLASFDLDYLERRYEWASKAPSSIRRPSQDIPGGEIEVPSLAPKHASKPTSKRRPPLHGLGLDKTAWITPRCPRIANILSEPKGRERRRQAVGVLLSAVDAGEANPELDWFIQELFEHPYMAELRQVDVLKWALEYERDGEIKVGTSCKSLGCETPQRKICGMNSPLDWKLIPQDLDPISIEEARENNLKTVQVILQMPGNEITVLNWPVGIGKTYALIQEAARASASILWLAQSHELLLQTQREFEEKGLTTAHVASRSYLAKNDGFECWGQKKG